MDRGAHPDSATEPGDDAAVGWADVLHRAQQARPLGPTGAVPPDAAAANDAPRPRRAAAGVGRRALAAACMVMAMGALVWWQAPSGDPVRVADGPAPDGPGVPRGAGPTEPGAGLPLVQVADPEQEARRWTAELERLGATVQTVPGPGQDLILDIVVADEARRMAVNTWLARFDQQLDGQGRLKMRLAAWR